jgi:hypothetical protein
MPIIGGMVNPNAVMEKVPSYDAWQSNRDNATQYTMTGPSTGSNGVATAPFVISLPAGVALPVPVIITPSTSGGTFTPTTVRLTDVDRQASFTYTLSGTGAKTIAVANDRGLANPASIVCTIS